VARRRLRELVVGDHTYLWSRTHRHEGAPEALECREVLAIRRVGARGRLEVVFRAGDGVVVPDGLLHAGAVGRVGGATVNLNEPGIVRALLDEAVARGFPADTARRVQVDGWMLLDAVVARRSSLALWTTADAWVFAALQGTGPGAGCPLTSVVRCADAINHAILTQAEFTRAVPRLVAAGLVGADPDADRYWHTDTGRELFARSMSGRGLFGWIDAIPPQLRRLGEPLDADWALPVGAYDRAVREYLRRTGALARRGGGRRADGR
jgi:hypothetical protein